ncbi:TraB/GumN family protein [Duganella sp. BJB488]|nr:TraB/GumN family protein [Duganella sp. BJB489]RFP26756.1 TraB/GumN family protein [Duganella sp. BJB488]RFP34511.1 TraB/GumN family protein [Duganella sp. BJB480]
MREAIQRQIIVMFWTLFCFVSMPAWAADKAQAPNHGALFKVQQGGHTLYLFGTIHVGAPDFYPLEPRIAAALKKAPVLALEIDPLGDQQNLMRAVQRHGMLAKGGPAGPELSADWRLRLDRLLKQYNIEPETVAAMKPWLLASLLTVSEFSAQGYEAALAVDSHLSKQAHQRGQKVVELESAESQMALFDQMSAEEQLVFLQEAIAGIEDKEQANQAREIADAWRKADVVALDALALKAEMDDTYSGRFVQKVLLDSRNPTLADGMVKLMARENNCVAAIGVLHLIGKGSVPELLRKRGLSVERIY